MALDITLIVVSSIFALLIIVAALYFLIYFQHPDDKWRAWFPKFVVVAGLSLSAYNIFLLPLDVANQRGSVTGGIPLGTMTMLTIVFYITTTIMVLVVVPFTVFWYEGLDNDDDVESSSLGKQILYAVKWVIPLDLLMFGGIIALYWFFGSASIKVVNLTGNLQPRGDFINFDYCAQPFTCIKTNTIVNVAVSPFVYVIACVSFLGSVIMSIFGGLGFIALPIDLIEGFIHRTKPISTALYEERKAIIGQKATILHEAGEAIMAEIKGQKQGGIGLNRRQRNLKRKENDFRRDVMIIEIHYQRLEDSYKHAGGDFLLQIGKLVAGIIGAVLSLFWILHIALYTIPMLIMENYISLFLNSFFEAVSNIPFIGTAFYALFSFYLLLCVIKGVTKMGMRIFFIAIHPMSIGDTMINSLVFNTGVILITSISVAQFCTTSFSEYSRYTASQSIFGVQVQNLQGLTFGYLGVVIGLPSFSVIYLFFHLYSPYKKQKENKMDFNW